MGPDAMILILRTLSFKPAFLWYVCVLVAKSCLTLCDPMDCGPPGSSVHGILQARILEWVAISFSRGSSQLRDQIPAQGSNPQVSCITGRLFTIWATRETFIIKVRYWPINFFVVALSNLISGWWWPHRINLRVFCLYFFWNSLRRITVSSYYVWQNSPVKSCGPELLNVGRFFRLQI